MNVAWTIGGGGSPQWSCHSTTLCSPVGMPAAMVMTRSSNLLGKGDERRASPRSSGGHKVLDIVAPHAGGQPVYRGRSRPSCGPISRRSPPNTAGATASHDVASRDPNRNLFLDGPAPRVGVSAPGVDTSRLVRSSASSTAPPARAHGALGTPPRADDPARRPWVASLPGPRRCPRSKLDEGVDNTNSSWRWGGGDVAAARQIAAPR